MDAVLLGGGQMALDDPLYPKSPDGRRSLIEIHGKSMAQWVLDALTKADVVRDIYIMGLTPDCGLTSSKNLHFMMDGSTLFENIRTGVLQVGQNRPEQTKVLLASADIPAVRSEMVQWLADEITKAPEALIYYNVVDRETMEKRFPNANRSFVKFKDTAVCGGDLNAVDTRLFSVERPIWLALSEARKNPLKQAMLLGLDNLALVALRLAKLETMVSRFEKKLDLQARALRCPFAEMAMDADKPHQLAILEYDLGRPA
jgi:GTP:adenosylcobinamide-phosphate guanylyltransferase